MSKTLHPFPLPVSPFSLYPSAFQSLVFSHKNMHLSRPKWHGYAPNNDHFLMKTRTKASTAEAEHDAYACSVSPLTFAGWHNFTSSCWEEGQRAGGHVQAPQHVLFTLKTRRGVWETSCCWIRADVVHLSLLQETNKTFSNHKQHLGLDTRKQPPAWVQGLINDGRRTKNILCFCQAFCHVGARSTGSYLCWISASWATRTLRTFIY